MDNLHIFHLLPNTSSMTGVAGGPGRQTTSTSSLLSISSTKIGYNFTESVLLGICLISIIIGTIIGNLLVCVAVFLVRRLRRPCNYLLVSLAVSDLCVALLVMPMALVYQILGTWPFGARVCDAWVALDLLSCTASILNLCMISVDRYLAITRPLDYCVRRTPRRMFLCVALVWLLAACISLPPLLVLGNEHGIDGLQCTVCQAFGYQIYATLGSFYIPLSVMAAVYYKIFQAARHIVREEEKAQSHLLGKPGQSGDTSTAVVVSRGSRSDSATHHLIYTTGSPRGGKHQHIDGEGVHHRRTSWPEVWISAQGSLSEDRFRRYSSVTAEMNDTNLDIMEGCDGHRGIGREDPAEEGTVTQPRCRFLPELKVHFSLAKERKASTTLGIIMSAFTLCWLPFFVLALIRPFMEHREQIPQWLSWLFLWLGYTNSLLNPVIYATTNKDFRLPFREIICLRCKSLNDIMREEFYQSQYGNPRPPASLNTLP